MTSTLTLDTRTLPTAQVGAPNPLPAVASMPQAPYEASTEGLPVDIAANIAYGQVASIHPYLLQDQYGRERSPEKMKLAVLENEHLRAEFALGLGGRLVRLFDKSANRELVYRNDIFQPANLALRGAWFSGGAEWNIGMRGHWPLTCAPLYAAAVTAPDGEPVLRMWEYERIRGLIVQLDATLEADALHVQVRVRNPHPHETGMYWWTNIAVAQTPGSRVFTAASHAYRTGYDGRLTLTDLDADDVSYPASAPTAADWFHDLPSDRMPWIAALDAHGDGLAHVSTRELKGRKLFVWGSGAGGRHWADWLGGSYFEIQAGLTTTQYEHLPMPGGATWEWQEAFLPVHVEDPAGAYADARERVGEVVSKASPECERLTAVADVAPSRMLQTGSPWGALEQVLAARYGSAFEGLPGVRFDADAGEDAAYWRELLGLGAAVPDALPRSYVAGELWDRLLAEAPESPLTHYHRGVISHARGDLRAAMTGYESSLRMDESAWARRALGLAKIASGETDAGIADLTAAFALTPETGSTTSVFAPLALELGEALLAAGHPDEVRALVATLPDGVRARGRFRVLEVRAALASGDRAEAGRLLEQGVEVPDIREGELSMSELWRQAFPDRPVPAQYDFTMS